MAYTTINNGKLYFNTKLYTGNGSSTQAITGVGFQPDWIWIKNRTDAHWHNLTDSVRGPSKTLRSNKTSAEATDSGSGYVSAFGTDGFTVSAGSSDAEEVNTSSDNYVSWNWLGAGTAPSKTYAVTVVSDGGNKYRFDGYGTSAVTLELSEGGTYTFDQSDASNDGHPLRFATAADAAGSTEYTTGVTTNGTPGNAGAYTRITVAASAPTLYYYCSSHSGMGGQANTPTTNSFSNFGGTIQSNISPNTTSGFSIVSFTGTAANATVGHGLGVAPACFITKSRVNAENWGFYHQSLGNGKQLELNTTAAQKTSSAYYNNTSPTSTVFSIGTADSTNDNQNMIAYCFAEKQGYSKFGSYTGTGSNVFIYTGFKVGWLLVKNADATNGWLVIDTTRSPANPQGKYIYTDSGNAEGTVTYGEFFSNGFGWKGTGSVAVNQSGEQFIYMAFADNPFTSSTGTPVTAR
jgi:hypothetical protein